MLIIRDQSGQSLVQVLLSVGVMGIAIAGFLAMMSHQSRESASLREQLASMDLQKTLIATLADGEVCEYLLNHPSPRTFDSSNVSSANPQMIDVTRIPVSASATAPSVVEVGGKASAYSSSLHVSSIRLSIESGSGNTYLGNWVVSFDPSKSTKFVRPVAVSTRLTVDVTSPAAARITACQIGSGGGGSETDNPNEVGLPCGLMKKGLIAYSSNGGQKLCCYIAYSVYDPNGGGYNTNVSCSPYVPIPPGTVVPY